MKNSHITYLKTIPLNISKHIKLIYLEEKKLIRDCGVHSPSFYKFYLFHHKLTSSTLSRCFIPAKVKSAHHKTKH